MKSNKGQWEIINLKDISLGQILTAKVSNNVLSGPFQDEKSEKS
jgi:hypothetical protein